MEAGGWDAAAVCAKAIAYAATLGAAGSIFFLTYGTNLLHRPQLDRIRRLIGISLLVAALASCLRILLSAAAMSGEIAGMFDAGFERMILGAGEGRALGVRIAGLSLAALALSPQRGFRIPAFVGAATASISFALVGHMQRQLPNVLPCLLLCVHLLCAAFWLGALVPLWMAGRDGNCTQVAALASRFGRIALGVVTLLLCAGAGLLWTLIVSAAPFWNSDYGRMMAVKLFFVTALLGVAAVNRLSLTPRLRNGQTKAMIQFKRNVQAEIVLGALILLVTAAFTTLSGPPR
jgi:putative copper resistance protein D